ncbi:MAG: hypothetical protein ACI9WU_002316 [Myxococcota bacterium]|jgi:hypothetical protein
MRRSTNFSGAVLMLATLSLAGTVLACAAEPTVLGPDTSGVYVAPDVSKADNYISTTAREFVLTGVAHATLPEGLDVLEGEARDAAIQKAVDSRLSRVASAVKSHINAVMAPKNGGKTGEKEKWFVTARRNSAEADAFDVGADGRARFEFELELVGSVYLMSAVAPEDASTRSFELTVSDWSGDNTEQVQVVIAGSESRDAFPKYNELFADGIFDIAIHFGGDYNEGRHDLETAKWTVETLLDSGWAHASVGSYDELTIDSGPFTRQVTVEGRAVEMRVKIVHSDMSEDANMVEAVDEARLSDSMKESLAMYDVIFYSGHAGEGSGFILDYQPKHEIKAAEFKDLEMPAKYQILVMDGCRTYRSYVDDIMANPAKNWDNTDIVTTVNTTPFGAGYYVIWEFLNWFTLTNDAGEHFPLSWKTILRGLNTDRYWNVHYGVHGIDNDPGLNPHKSDVACDPCSSDSDCGAGGNLCLGYGTGNGCGVACATDTACPDGYRCARLIDDPELFYLPKQCVKRDHSCR